MQQVEPACRGSLDWKLCNRPAR